MSIVSDLLTKMIEQKGSDLFITVGMPACIKSDGIIKNLNDIAFTPQQTTEIILSMMDENQKNRIYQQKRMQFCFAN